MVPEQMTGQCLSCVAHHSFDCHSSFSADMSVWLSLQMQQLSASTWAGHTRGSWEEPIFGWLQLPCCKEKIQASLVAALCLASFSV